MKPLLIIHIIKWGKSMKSNKFFTIAICCILGMSGGSFKIVNTYASQERDFDEDVKSGLLYSNEDGQITDKNGNVIPEYEYIEVEPRGGVLCYGEVMECYTAGAGGKIIYSIPESVEYSDDSEVDIENIWNNIIDVTADSDVLENTYMNELENGTDILFSYNQDISRALLVLINNSEQEYFKMCGDVYESDDNNACYDIADYEKGYYITFMSNFDNEEFWLYILDLDFMVDLYPVTKDEFLNCIQKGEEYTEYNLDGNEEEDFADVEDEDSDKINEVTENIDDRVGMDNGYYNLYDIIDLEECSSYLGEKVYYSGGLIDNTNSIFTISGGGVRMPYVTAYYDTDIIDNAPSNQILRENPVYVTVWGTLTGDAQMDLEHICMGGSDAEKETAKLVDFYYFRGDWPEEIGETVKCIGVFRNDGRWEALERPRDDIDILEEFCKANEYNIQKLYSSLSNSISLSINIDVYGLPIYGYNSLDSFADTPVAVYGSMVGTGAMVFDYIEPLPPEEWTYDIESMMEDTEYILTEKDEYIHEHLAELW